MEYALASVITLGYFWMGYGAMVLAKTSPHTNQDVPRVLVIVVWPLILVIASFEAGK